MSCCHENNSTVESKFDFSKEHKILKIDFKSYWDWNTHNDKCPICRNFLFEPSVESENVTTNSNGLRPVIGVCGHAFHADCIENWRRTRNVCPLCNVRWQEIK